jgi:hypothetical protein
VKKFLLAVAVAAVATMGIVSSASAGVERYQTQTLTITAVQPEGQVGQWTNVWTHTYTAELNPCNGSFSGGAGSFSGVGSVKGTNDPFVDTETITGDLDGNNVSFTATRDSDSLVYSLSNAPLDGETVTLATSNPEVSWPLEFKVTATIESSTYKNHGEYVAQQGGGSDAAHSCIGMPIS